MSADPRLVASSSLEDVDAYLRQLRDESHGLDPLTRATVREAALRELRGVEVVSSPAGLVDAALYAKNGGRDDGGGAAQGEPEQQGDARCVAPPSRPMEVARQLVEGLYSHEDGPLLRDWRGDFYSYDGTCWPEVDARVVRAAAYTYLEHAKYESPDGLLADWAPTRHKITNVIDALRAVVILDSAEPPVWSPAGRDDPPA